MKSSRTAKTFGSTSCNVIKSALSSIIPLKNIAWKYELPAARTLHLIRNNNEFCDIDIHVGNETFRAHKVVLAVS
jgi:hypothetical protein